MKKISDLTQEEKASLDEHYTKQVRPVLDPLVRAIAEVVAHKDKYGLLFIIESCQVLFKHAIEQLDDDDEMPLTLKGWPTSVAGGEGGTTDKKV